MAGARRSVVVTCAVIALVVAGTLTAWGQVDPTVPTLPPPSSSTSTSTTSTSAPEDESTTTTSHPGLFDDRDEEPEPEPGDGDHPSRQPAPPDAGAPASPDGAATGDSFDESLEGRVVPPDMQALIDSVRRTRGNDTSRLLQALSPLEDLGLSTTDAAVMGMGRFPVAGHATFGDHWWLPRFVPTFHLHEGTDIFAAAGTPVRAPFDGVLRQAEGPVGGLAAYIDMPDGGYVYMAHLAGFVPGQVSGQAVKTGDVVGYVGDTGNAKGGSPHVHFELHPAPTKEVVVGKGKQRHIEVVTVSVAPGTPLPPVNPKPHLDAWIEEAIAAAPQVVARYQASRPRALLTTGLTRRLSDGSGVFSAPSRPPRSQLLWTSSANPSGGSFALASAHVDAAAASIDWDSRTRAERARIARWERADARAVKVLTPLQPRALRPLLFSP